MKYPKALLFPMILFQLGILAFMVFNAMRPLQTGVPITFKTQPVDPRDLMRGNYVRLGYPFSEIKLHEIEHNLQEVKAFKEGDVGYLWLQPDGIYHKSYKLSKAQPNEKDFPFLKVYITDILSEYSNIIRLKAGIESYYTDKENALALETMRRDEEITINVEVMLAPHGVARIKELQVVK